MACTKILAVLVILIVAVNAYRIEDRLKSDLQALAQDVEEMEARRDNDEFFKERRGTKGCKYPGDTCGPKGMSHGCHAVSTTISLQHFFSFHYSLEENHI